MSDFHRSRCQNMFMKLIACWEPTSNSKQTDTVKSRSIPAHQRASDFETEYILQDQSCTCLALATICLCLYELIWISIISEVVFGWEQQHTGAAGTHSSQIVHAIVLACFCCEHIFPANTPSRLSVWSLETNCSRFSFPRACVHANNGAVARVQHVWKCDGGLVCTFSTVLKCEKCVR